MQQDLQLVKQRLIDYFLSVDTIGDGAKVKLCRVSQAAEYAAIQNEDGSWDEVDYTCTASAANGVNWDPYLALDYMQMMAIAYQKPGHPCYHDPKVLNGVERALLHWKTIRVKPDDPDYEGCWSVNWWENENGVQLRFSRIGLFLENELSEEAMGVILRKLPYNGLNTAGQNAVWGTQNAIYRALLTNDPDKLMELVHNHLATHLRMQLTDKAEEAIQVDYSAHCHGALFFSNGYGMSLFRDISFWMEMLHDTAFAMPHSVIELMSDYMLKGTRWTIRKELLEVAQGYIMYWDKSYAQTYVRPLERIIEMGAPSSNELQKVLDNIRGLRPDCGANGNHYMWTSGYMGHMRPEYGVNVRMDSHVIKGAEWRATWPDEAYGNSVFWTCANATTVSVDGDEYHDVYPQYDWRHVPGVTAPLSLSKQYGADKDRDFCMGLSDGRCGSTGYTFIKYDGEGTTCGTTSVFLLDKEYVALGAGIESDSPAPIHTTLNQTKANTPTVNGCTVNIDTDNQLVTGRYAHNDQVGYVFFADTPYHAEHALHKPGDYPSLWKTGYTQFSIDADETRKDEHTLKPTFSLWLDHGVKPHDASYAYIVLPAATAEETKYYSQNIPVTVLQNDTSIQAIRHCTDNTVMANFFVPGELDCGNGQTISVDHTCAVSLKEEGDEMVLSVAVSNDQPHAHVTVKENGYTWELDIPALPYTGQTIMKRRKKT